MSNLGCDPELFVQKKGQRVGHAISVHEMPGNERLTVRGLSDDREWGHCNDYSWLITDGWAVEINTKGSTCRDYLVPGIAVALRDFYARYPEYKLSAVPSQQLGKESVSGDVPFGVNEFGCLPDMDAYSLRQKTPPTTSYPDRFRYAGGHIHVELQTGGMLIRPDDDVTLMRAAVFSLMADMMLAVPLVAMLGNSNDYGEAQRRTLYGQAGSFRVKNYGVEYRVPSSAIMLSPIMMYWVWGQMRQIRGYFDRKIGTPAYTDDRADRLDKYAAILTEYAQWQMNTYPDIPTIINTHDVEWARDFMGNVIFNQGGIPFHHKDFYDLLLRADAEEIPFNTNLYESWGLGKPIINHFWSGVESLFTINENGHVRGSYDGHGVQHVGFNKQNVPFLDLVPRSNFGGWNR